MNERRLFTPILLAITLVALLVRVVPSYDRVITPEAVRFQSVDPYYHVRLSKYLTEHFPHRLEFDSLRLHPGGQRVDVYPAYDAVNAVLALIVGLGSPSDRTTEEVIAWSPPLLGAATVFCTGMAARTVAGPWGGLAAAVVAGFLPGGTLPQSVIGLSDHHALETLLLSCAWWLLSLLLRSDGSARRRLALAAALGASAAGYALTWEGGPVLPTVIGICVALTMVSRADAPPIHERWAREAGLMTLTAVAVAWSAGFWSPMITTSMTLLLLVAFLPLTMILVRRAVGPANVRRTRIAWVAAVVAAGVAVALLLPSDLTSSLMTNLGRFDPSDRAKTVSELRPLIEEPGLLWQYFGFSLPWAVAGAVIVIVRLRRERDDALLVSLVAGAIFVPGALLQIRFASSASLPIALLTGVVIHELIEGSRVARASRRRTAAAMRTSALALWCLSVPVWISSGIPSLAAVDRGPSSDWISVTHWLRSNTPELDTIWSEGSSPVVRRPGILNWWDSGYYLTTMAERVPVSNPSQAGARSAAEAFLDTTGERGVHGLGREAIRYVIAEAALALRPTATTSVAGLFPALPVWADVPLETFVRQVHFPGPNGSFESRFAYLPAYYRTLLVRLLLADGDAVEPAPRAAWAIQLEPRVDQTGRRFDVVRSSRSFANATAAASFMKTEADSTWLVVGFSPFEPCVPLEPVRNVRLVHASPTIALAHPTLRRPMPALKVFAIEELR